MKTLVAALLGIVVTAQLDAAITGNVVDEEMTPLAGIAVRAFRPESSEDAVTRAVAGRARTAMATATTDAEGTFSLDVAGAGNVVLSIAAPGFAPTERMLDREEAAGLIVLHRGGMREGRVTGPDGKPVAGALMLVHLTPLFETRSGDDGRFTFPDTGMPTMLAAIHPEFAPASRPAIGSDTVVVTLERGTAIKGRVVLGEEQGVAGANVSMDGFPAATTDEQGAFTIAHAPKDLDSLSAVSSVGRGAATPARGSTTISIKSGTRVHGTVSDERQRPLSGIAVVLFNEGDQRVVVTDDRGAFSASHLPPGTYSVMILDATRNGGDMAQLHVGKAPVKRDFVARKWPAITGVVKLADGTAVSGASVALAQHVDRSHRRAAVQNPIVIYTDRDGKFLLRAAGPGSYVVQAAKRGLAPGESAVFGLKEGETRREVGVTLSPGLPVNGRVIDSSGRGIAGVAVTPESAAIDSDDERPWVATGDDGSFILKLEPGDRSMVFGKEGYVSETLMDVVISAKTAPISVTLAASATIEGKLLASDGTPVANAMVASATQRGLYTVTAADGSFKLDDLESGKQQVVARKDSLIVSEELEAPARGVRLVLPSAHTIRGRVVDSVGKPVEEFQISASPKKQSEAAHPFDVFRSADGSFELEVPEGTFSVTAAATNFLESEPQLVKIEAGAPLDALVFTLSRGRTVRGRVMADGKPLEGVSVSSSENDDGIHDLSAITTAADGTFEVSAVRVGEVSLSFSKEEYPKTTRQLPAGESDVRLDVELKSGLALRGRVVDAAGNAVVARVGATSPMHGAEMVWATSDASGAFQLKGLLPGRYDLEAQTEDERSGKLADVDSATAKDVVIRLTPQSNAVITGHVEGIDPKWLTKLVTTVRSESDYQSTTIDGSGNFRLEHAPTGEVEIYAQMADGRRWRYSKRVTVNVKPDSETRVNLVLIEGFTVRGRVTRGGEPLAGAQVQFRSESNDSNNPSTITDALGGYQVEDVLPGGNDVEVTTPGNRGSSVTHTAVAGPAVFDIAVDLTTVKVTVIDAATELPLSDAKVSIRGEGTHSGATANTIADGSAVLDLPRGKSVIGVEKEGYASANASSDGSSRTVVVKLAPSAGAAVRLIDARDGRTLSGYAIARDDDGQVLASASDNRRDGTLLLPLAPGTYRFSGSAEGYGSHTITATLPGNEVRIPLLRGGQLLLRSDQPLQGKARLIDTSGEEYVRCWCNGIAEIVIKGTSTTVDRVSPGAYTLEVVLGGGRKASYPVTVVEGETMTVLLTP